MATDLTSTDAKVPAPATHHASAPTSRPSAPHRWRFLFIYGTLAAVLGLAVVGAVIYAGRSINPSAKWSAWKPSGGGLGAAKQIAEHIGGAYRLPSGQQLVDVIAQAPSVSPDGTHEVPIHYVALRGAKGVVGKVFSVDSGNSLTYTLCGSGASCTIDGTPSAARGTLVRREALELALYTFKYIGGIKSIVAFTPASTTHPTLAVYLQKSDFAAELKRPLTQTLNAKVPLPAKITAKEQETIDATTQSRVFTYKVSQGPQGDVILFLQPFA